MGLGLGVWGLGVPSLGLGGGRGRGLGSRVRVGGVRKPRTSECRMEKQFGQVQARKKRRIACKQAFMVGLCSAEGSCSSGAELRVHGVGHIHLMACHGYTSCLNAMQLGSVAGSSCIYSTGMYFSSPILAVSIYHSKQTRS